MTARTGQAVASRGTRPVSALLPLMGLVLVAFLVIGMAMPVLPLSVHDELGFDTVMVGLVAGSQFAAALLSRPFAGSYADRAGPKRAVLAGLITAAVSGAVYLVSLWPGAAPSLSIALLVAGRLLLGCAESFMITGAVSWGFGLVDARSTGRVIAWVGAAMFGAFALGAPIGAALYDLYGFASIAWATLLAPFLTMFLILALAGVAPAAQVRHGFTRVLRAVWAPGLGSALSSVAFGGITAFVTLLFVERGWSHGWLPYSLFAGVFIGARLVFGHLPDRLGGARVAMLCLLVEAVGQALIWFSPWPSIALVGAGLTGLGYSLVYPGLGAEAMMRVPAESRGLAMGAYTAFLDLSLGASGPLLGLVAASAGIGSVFLAGAFAAVVAIPIALSVSSRRH